MNVCAVVAAAATLASVLTANLAQAATFNFSFQSANVSGSGTLSSGTDNTDPFTITSATGSIMTAVGSFAITGIATTYLGAPVTSNVYLTGGSLIDPITTSFGGLAFSTGLAGDFVLYASNSSVTGYRVRSSANSALADATVLGITRTDVVATPGPVAGAGLASLFGLGNLLWARRRFAA